MHILPIIFDKLPYTLYTWTKHVPPCRW